MSSIPGLEHLEKEGWEIARFDYASRDEWFVDSEGRVIRCGFPGGTEEKKIIVDRIIRKIERPKQYRPFANAAEAETLWDAKLQFKGHDADRFRVTAIRSTGVTIGGSTYRYEEAFERLECSDGTPFGVEVTS